MQSRRVLFVDDEPALVSLTVRALDKLGYCVTGVTDPRKALALFHAEPAAFDVVITDLSMPAISGLELAREMWRLRPELPLLLISGFVSATDHDESIAYGFREIVHKPFTIETLVEKLDQLFAELA